MTDLKRYKLMANVGAVVDVVPNANGAWVRWEDHQARVAELESECLRLLNRATAAEERADALQRCLQSQPAV